MSNKLSALLRVGVSFESSILCMGEPVARARHWDICHVDKKTGELFTVRDLENERV